MLKKNKYDILIIGGGISACVFASKVLKNNPKVKIAIIEAGRGLGGRSSTRISKRFKGWKLNHGSPNLNISNMGKGKLIDSFIKDLLKNRFITIDDSSSFELSNNLEHKIVNNFELTGGNNYISSSTMGELSHNIISLHNSRDQIDFIFKTLIQDLSFDQNQWILKSKEGKTFYSEYLVCSSNLLLHKRSMQILNINQIPLRKAIPENKDKDIDKLLQILNEQSYVPRLSFLIYTKTDYVFKDKYLKKNRYFYLDNHFEEIFKFERLIFQLQENNNLGIVVHTKNKDLINYYLKEKKEEKFKQKIFSIFNKLYDGNAYVNKLKGNEDISIMYWRASQPLGVGVPLKLQFCLNYKIGFCGDWFKDQGFGKIEGAISSSLKLAEKFKSLNF